MDYLCFEMECNREAQYVCLCLCSEAFWCENHFKKHLKMLNRNHNFDSIYSELSDLSIDGILKYLSKEKLKKTTLNKIALSVLKDINNPKSYINKKLDKLKCDLKQISDLIIKISKVSEKEKVSLLNSLILQPNSFVETWKNMPLKDSDSNIKLLFFRLGQLKNKTLMIADRVNNSLDTEQEFRKTCALYENNASNFLISQAYKDYVKAYQKITSLYHINSSIDTDIELFIYDTENEREHLKIFKNPFGNIGRLTSIIQLPNGELFIYGYTSYRAGGFALLIDKNDRFRWLNPKSNENILTAIYFNKSIYCFTFPQSLSVLGNHKPLFTQRFDLDANRWINLAPIDKYLDLKYWRSTVFNRNILISQDNNCNILLYSIDIDSFSTIPYSFAKTAKILINAEDRLYLIENGLWIYESGISDEYNWEKIFFSGLKFYGEIYCSYNKGAIHISACKAYDGFRQYFKFDLSKKRLIEIACFGYNFAIKKLDGKLKTIECYGQNFKLVSDYIKKGFTLYDIALKLEKSNIKISKILRRWYYKMKGDVFHELGWDLDAIKWYNKAIKLESDYGETYYLKGNALMNLGKNLEAINCYNEAIKLRYFENWSTYRNKGIALHNLGKNLEAIDCYNEAIKLKPDQLDCYFFKGDAFHEMGQNIEALKCCDTAMTQFRNGDAYFKKAVFLQDLNKSAEALECYNEAINIKSQDPKYFCYRAYLFNDLGQEEEAIQDFNRAYELVPYFYFDCIVGNDCLQLLKILSKLLEVTIIVKEELQKIKDANLDNLEIINLVKEKELLVKEKRSELIKRAVECLYSKEIQTIESIQQMKKEVLELQKATIDIVIQLCLLISLQE